MKTPLFIILGLALAANLSAQQPANTPAPIAPPVALATPGPALSKATLAKIAAMTPLFDDRTLDGWIQAPPAPLTFSASDIADLPELARKLMEQPDAISAFLGEQLDAPAKTSLSTFAPTDASIKEFTAALLKNLNRIVGGASIYEAARFQKIRLRPTTEALRKKNPSGQDLARLNRVLLEDAFPRELAESPATSWLVKDGTMASTGAGRGVIYTKADYTHYRLIFSLRHVSGKPDHQPCILIFCSRPADGEKGLDALGGIQFQAPNGGHWDYRPGHNNAGASFANPVKPRFDNHEWSQVEILVNAKDGTARMAVAQPLGTRATENLVFHELAAGKPGTIAWQMHNAGLFDEFKDVRIELDPKEDRLITVE